MLFVGMWVRVANGVGFGLAVGGCRRMGSKASVIVVISVAGEELLVAARVVVKRDRSGRRVRSIVLSGALYRCGGLVTVLQC